MLNNCKPLSERARLIGRMRVSRIQQPSIQAASEFSAGIADRAGYYVLSFPNSEGRESKGSRLSSL